MRFWGRWGFWIIPFGINRKGCFDKHEFLGDIRVLNINQWQCGMADNNNKDEPSIEEILSSIRDIISEDDEAEAAPPPKKEQGEEPEPVAETEPSADQDDDVLDLTEMADDEDPLAGIDLKHPEDDLDVDDIMNADLDDDSDGLSDILGGDDDVAMDEDDDFMAVHDQDDDGDADQDEGLVDKVAETATVGAMMKLAENIALSKRAEGVTLEDIVANMLKPMLKDWLDDNLPALIERLVEKELQRLAEKAARK